MSGLAKLPQILKYGSTQIMLEASIKPQVKATTMSAIKVLKQVAFQHKIVSLSANQIGLDQRVFVCLKEEIMRPGKWRNYDQILSDNQYEAIINPIEVSSSYRKFYAFEECPSFEGIQFKVKAPVLFNIEFSTEADLKKKEVKQISGFRGRVWDHQIRHLEGLLPIRQNICNGQFYLLDDYKDCIENIEFWRELRAIQSQYLMSEIKKTRAEKKQQMGRENRMGSVNERFESLFDVPEGISEISRKLSEAQKSGQIHKSRIKGATKSKGKKHKH